MNHAEAKVKSNGNSKAVREYVNPLLSGGKKVTKEDYEMFKWNCKEIFILE
ncbi:MAG: hypothetical protein HZA07_06370 [Nitrospirae bacterium]|nr:hypothetical protein [Nitrospirota bacterium]